MWICSCATPTWWWWTSTSSSSTLCSTASRCLRSSTIAFRTSSLIWASLLPSVLRKSTSAHMVCFLRTTQTQSLARIWLSSFFAIFHPMQAFCGMGRTAYRAQSKISLSMILYVTTCGRSMSRPTMPSKTWTPETTSSIV